MMPLGDWLNLYSVAQGRRTVIHNSTFDRKLPAILYETTFDSLVTIFRVYINFFSAMVKSPTRRCWRRDCSVTKEEEIWIIKHSDGRGATALLRLFIRRHNLSNHHTVLYKNAFKRLVQRFNATGGVTGTNQGKTPIAVMPENIARVQAFFEENPTKSIASAARESDISFRSIPFILHLGPHSIRIKRPSASSRGPRRSCAGPPWLATQC